MKIKDGSTLMAYDTLVVRVRSKCWWKMSRLDGARTPSRDMLYGYGFPGLVPFRRLSADRRPKIPFLETVTAANPCGVISVTRFFSALSAAEVIFLLRCMVTNRIGRH